MRELVERLMTAGQWMDGDPEILIVVDAGYDVPRLAFLLKDLPAQVLGRMRSDASCDARSHLASPVSGPTAPPRHPVAVHRRRRTAADLLRHRHNRRPDRRARTAAPPTRTAEVRIRTSEPPPAHGPAVDSWPVAVANRDVDPFDPASRDRHGQSLQGGPH
jgi:hypothetical protein